jgi:hypothetical protein
VHIAALSEDCNGGEEIDDELLCHEEVEEPSPGLDVAGKSQYEER